MKVGIAAAGSGGHVFPAIAVADELRLRGLASDDIVFFGGDRMEASTVPEAGYRFVGVDIHGLRRSLSVDNLKLPRKVMKARSTIVEQIATDRIDVMVVFGGYIAGPAALAASKSGIPLIVHEANAVPGLANRMVARRADTVYVAFAPSLDKLKGATVIGSPLRQAFSSFDRSERRAAARLRYGVGETETVLGIVGGSLGAQFLNEVAAELASDSSRGFSIIHVTGPTHIDAIGEAAASADGWYPIAFEEDMASLYAAADLVLSRAGALTISELQATSTPAVVVPLPAGGGYQALNAADLAEAGAVVIEHQSDVATVAGRVRDLIADRAALVRMGEAPSSVNHREAAATVADRILEVGHA